MRLAAVQPRSRTETDEHRNLDDALRWMSRAAEAGAALVVFPEGYPGPMNPRNRYDSVGPLRDAARDLEMAVVASHLVAAHADNYHVALTSIAGDGEVAGTYLRTTPNGPYIYQDIPAWAFDYVSSSEPARVVELAGIQVGTLVCSEVYVPELSRLLALQGAQVLAYPAGGAINELRGSWRTMVRARAIENLTYSVAVQNLYATDEQGVGIIAGPEGDLVTASGEDLLLADLDFSRLAYLRETEEQIVFPKPYETIPGVLAWRRPELFDGLTHQRQPEAI